MNIKRAKDEIKDAIESYLLKNEYDEYVIPIESQRPVLLIGPPGVGKTAIMQQIATECGVGLVAYTITHHTRQSAIGLPFIEEKEYAGKKYSVTEYTMSEIIGAVYEKMELTGLKEGILFIDEINCASETLAPAMLQFLQYKTFGSHSVPKGWIIVAAGNPPQYNKSVRDFDVVTLDRVKKIDVEEDYGIWREYAVFQNVHNAVITYLDIKTEAFYSIKNTAEGKIFVTARGWEDLSKIIYVYEALKKKVDFQVVAQYVQNPKIARDFSSYLELYYKYKNDYSISDILTGKFKEAYIDRLRLASFDEKLGVISLILGALNEGFRAVDKQDKLVTEMHNVLKSLKEIMVDNEERPEIVMKTFLNTRLKHFDVKKKAQLFQKEEEILTRNINNILETYIFAVKESGANTCIDGFNVVRGQFNMEVEKREELINTTAEKLENSFEFMEKVFGEGQEMVVFVTELNSGYFSIKFINENGCVKFYHYNKNLLFKQQQQSIVKEIDELNQLIHN
ncbi:MAG: ATP-binding protein [Anaerotignaceae bacterium]